MHSESVFAREFPVHLSTRFVQEDQEAIGSLANLPRSLVIAATMFWTSIFMDEMFLTSYPATGEENPAPHTDPDLDTQKLPP